MPSSAFSPTYLRGTSKAGGADDGQCRPSLAALVVGGSIILRSNDLIRKKKHYGSGRRLEYTEKQEKQRNVQKNKKNTMPQNKNATWYVTAIRESSKGI